MADDSDKNTEIEKATSSAENIDHILDNMFTQRQPYEPTISLKDSQASSQVPASDDNKIDDQLNDGMNVSFEKLSIACLELKQDLFQAMTVNDEKSDAK